MAAVKQKLQERFGTDVKEGPPTRDMPSLEVAPNRILEVCRYLRDESPWRFEQLTDLTATDEWPREPRFRVVYHLLSLSANQRLRLVATLPGEEPELDSVTSVWRGADWLEREAWDMFGIRFRGHPDPKRILMPEGYRHHPLRKDFPVRGIDPSRDYREWDQGRKA